MHKKFTLSRSGCILKDNTISSSADPLNNKTWKEPIDLDKSTINIPYVYFVGKPLSLPFKKSSNLALFY